MKQRLVPALGLILIIAATALLAGCHRKLAAVPIEKVEVISEETFMEGGVEVKVTKYAGGSFYIKVRNALEGYRLREIPTIFSGTGSLVVPAIKDNNEISFNYHPISQRAVEDEKDDITVQWILCETGEEGFLIVRKTISIDIGLDKGLHHVNSVKVLDIADE